MLSAIVVAYRNGAELLACCESLAAAADIRHVIVVNNSWDFPVFPLERASSGLKVKIVVIEAMSNLGYARGNNLGIERAVALGSSSVLICNPDVLIAPNSVAGLLDELQEEGLELISPHLIELDRFGVSQALRSPCWDQRLGRGLLDGFGVGKTPTFFGACFVAQVGLMKRIGNLSEDFFLYGEETDFCMRMAAEGPPRWRVSVTFGVSHSRGLSISPAGVSLEKKSEVAFQQSARSAIILGRRYWPKRVYFWTFSRVVLSFLLIFRGRGGAFRAVMSGLYQGWRLRLTPPSGL